MKILKPLLFLTIATAGSTFAVADENGPAQLAVSFMTQFYDVSADSVQVTVIKKTRLSATVKAEAKEHVCIFDAQPLPTAQYGWAASSMNCKQ